MLSGYKSYICFGVIGLAGIAFGIGWITKEQFEVIAGIFGGAGGIALRAGVEKSGPQQ